MREGEVRFYTADDPLTGKWLFKVCFDAEMQRTIIKALKCPPGKGFAQLEGSTLLFQKSLVEGKYYSVISLSYIDGDGRLRKNVVENVEEVPETIKKSFKIASYEEATGKKIAGKRIVALCDEKDDKKMIVMFLLQRAWPLAKITIDFGAKIFDLLEIIKKLEKAQLTEIYQAAKDQYGLMEEEIETLLGFLESEGKILRFEGYVKTR